MYNHNNIAVVKKEPQLLIKTDTENHHNTERAKSIRSLYFYIFHIKPYFFKTLFQSQFLFDIDEIFI
jgi:hypothetical protein